MTFSRRTPYVASAVILLTLLAGFLVFFPYLQAMRERSRRQQIVDNLSQIGLAIRNYESLAGSLEEPRESFKASLEGDTTILTVTLTNPNQAPIKIKEVVMQGLTLGKVEPTENATLPIRVPEIAPGESSKFVLHYDQVPWISDEIPVNRQDLNWALQTISYGGTWSAVVENIDQAVGDGTAERRTERKGTFNATGVPVLLDSESARALKKRRDDRLKSNAEADQSRPKP